MRTNTPSKIITHTAVTPKYMTAEDVDRFHIARWPGFTSKTFKNKEGKYWTVGYHFVIEWDGTIVPTRGVLEEGAHCVGQNLSSIGVCFMGDGDKHMPSPEQKASWKTLYKRLNVVFPNITPHDTYPHRKYANKTCHGSKLSDTYFADLLLPRDVEQQKKLIVKLSQQVISLLQLLIRKRMSLHEKS
jgi:N-acetylmuramoyl-L-alanine amidase